MNLSLLFFYCYLKPLKSLFHPFENQLAIKDRHIGLTVIHKEKYVIFRVITNNSPMRIFSIFISQYQHSFCLLLPELMYPIMCSWLPKLKTNLIAYSDCCDCISVGNERMKGRMSHTLHEQDAYLNAISINQKILELIFLLEIGVVVCFSHQKFSLFHYPVFHYLSLKSKAIQFQSFCLFFT